MAYFVNTPTSPFKTPEQAVAIGENIVDFLHNFWISVALAATKIITQNSLWSASTTQYVPAPQPSSNLQIQNTPPTATIISAPILTNPKSVQDQLDDIQEKLDIIKAQVQELFAAQNPIKQTEILDQVLNPDEQTNPKQDDTNKKTENNTAKHVGGGGSPVIYPKILISEVKISEKSGDKNIFIELYNPNNTAVDLTGWYIFRNDTSFVTSTILSGKGILAGGYFLATRQGSSWDSLADLYFDGTLNDNDKISLKNPNGDIVDEISWLQILAGISYGRKWDLTSNTEQYFELQTPTPKAQNVSAPEKSNDTKITSTTYAIDQTELTITNVPFATSKIDFENALIKNESHQIWDDSKISDPVATGDNLTVAAENGTMATYTITVKEPNVVKPNITGYTLNGLAQNVTFRPGTLEPVVIEINTNEPVKFNRIYICLASATACDGSHYVKYFTQTTSYVSTISKSWDGKSSGGAIVADGVYKIVADIVNQDGKQTINNLTPYTITVSATNWAQGTVDSFTSDGKFVFHTSDFMPKQSMSCYFATKKFRDIYPSKSNQFGSSSGGCSTAYPAYNLDMSANKTIGEYDVYVSYCGNNDCLAGDPVGDYYRVYFDGTTWSTLPVDSTKTRQSNDVDVSVSNFYVVSSLSATYKSGFFSSGTGTISNVRFATSKSDFEKAIVPPLEAVMDYSLVNDPVLNGDILKVTSQSGAVKATYTITVDPISWSQGVITSNTGAKFYLDTSFITTTPSLTCNSRLHRSLYPFQNNSLSQGSFTCNDKNIRPVYAVDFSSYTTVGDYTIWLSDPSTNLGKYYQMNFDGTTWLAMNPVVLSNDAKILSSVYTIDQTALTITNVPAVTSKADFENNISKSESHQTWDDSKILDPVATGDTITVTAEDGTTKIYTITVNPVVILPVITNYTFNESAQNIVVNPIKDSVQIGLTSNENVNWMYIRVVSSTDPTVYKTFGSGTGCVDGTTTCSKVWDGSISHGTALVDGDYQIKVHIKDDAEKEFEDFLSPYIITVNSEL